LIQQQAAEKQAGAFFSSLLISKYGCFKDADFTIYVLEGGIMMKFIFRKKYTGVSMLFLAAIIIISFLSGCLKAKYNDKLSDLGGVYSSRFIASDYKKEISGILSEGGDEPVASYNKNLLRWGISRRSNHETPAADPGAPELLQKYGSVYIGDTSRPVIYLTFDEGYENGYTPMILDVLREYGVKAVFFITGPYLKEHQDLVRRMVEEGHIVGNHTINHPSLPELDDSRIEEEVLGLERAFKENFDRSMPFLRPPKGEYSERTLALTYKLGYCNLFWSFAYDDWYRDRSRGPQYAYDIVMRNLHNGAVLLLHAVSKDNAQALESIIKGAREMGYTIGDPLELIPSEKTGDFDETEK